MIQSIGRYKAIGIILLVMCLGAIGCSIAVLCLPVLTMQKIKACFFLLACAAALYYMLKGYSKNAAAAFKAFMAILFITFQILAVNAGMPNVVRAAALSFVACLIAGLYLVLAAVENLGEKLSKGMAITAASINAAQFISNLLIFPGVFSGGEIAYTAAILNSSAATTLSLIAVAMVFAKYKDKTERGTK